MRRWATTLLRWLAEGLIRIYYPSRTLQGAENLPAAGPALYVANHPNGLMDPLVLRVTIHRRVRFLAKSTLYANPFGRLAMDAFECLPVYRQQDLGGDEKGGETVRRNEETFARCRGALARGAELALYPEGASHSDPRLKPLKSGAARIALSATAEANESVAGGAAAARSLPALVPVGLHYRDKARFRSAVRVVVGPPIDLRRYGAEFKVDPRAAIDGLTSEIRFRLDELVLQAETRDLLARMAGVAVTQMADGPGRAPQGLAVREDPPVERLPGEGLPVNDAWQLETPRVSARAVAADAGRAVLWFPAALWGYATSWIPYRLTGLAARRATRDEDIVSTMKMIGGAAFLAGAWLLEAGLLSWRFGIRVGLLSLVVAAPAGYLAVRFTETATAVARGIRHLAWNARRSETALEPSERQRRLSSAVADALRDLPP